MEPTDMSRKIFSMIESDALVRLTRQMIAIPSPNFEEAAIADFLAEKMQAMGMEVDMMTVDHPTDATKKTRQPIGRLRGTGGGKSLMFNGHTDVNVMMPGWTIDPIVGKYEGGWIWGLGAQDDKGGLAAALIGLESIIKSGTRLRGDVLMCPVATHKLGGTGTRTLLKNGVRSDYCINIEHSANTIGSVIIGSVRVKLRTNTPGLFFRFTEETRATYWNSIEQIAMLIGEFGTSLTPLPEGGWLNFKRHPELLDFPMIRHDTIHKDHYGRWCDLVFQIRTVPGMTLDGVRTDVARVLERVKKAHPTLDCEVMIPANGPEDPFYMDPCALAVSHPLVRAVANGYRAATGNEPLIGSVERIGNFGDGNVLAAAGIPSVQFGPGDIKRYPEWPAPDERVHIDELMVTAKSCVGATLELCA
jgi:acetylornithine deacetylase